MLAEAIYDAIHGAKKGIELPDLSQHKATWFTRQDAIGWTKLGYSTVKQHLRDLEEEGLVQSTVAQNNRECGKQIHFRIVDGRTPPFERRNPFEGLPDLAVKAA